MTTTNDLPLLVTAAEKGRVLRVFVSSTFSDMMDDRNALAADTFKRFRQACAERGVILGVVDLRWGITSEQKSEGKVLPICLAEIRKCRPFFIALLGERYGWDEFVLDEELLHAEPWLKGKESFSITELEVLHGALNDPDAGKYARIYLRDPGYVESIPIEQRGNYVEGPREEELQRLGKKGAEARAAARRRKLKTLKTRIEKSNLLFRKYADPKELKALVGGDLDDLLDEHYPASETPDPLERERARHKAIAWSLAEAKDAAGVVHGAYQGRREWSERLDSHAAGDGPALVVEGPAGIGKSALLANWALRYEQQNPDTFVIFHSCGATSSGATALGASGRILRELASYALTTFVPGTLEERSDALRFYFALLARSGRRVVLILDGLDKLEDQDDDLDLTWIPEGPWEGVRLILSSSGGRSLEALRRRNWPSLPVAELTEEERGSLARHVLEVTGQTLEPALVDELSKSDAARLPIALRLLLDEARLSSSPDELAAEFPHYLSATSTTDLFVRVLRRLQRPEEVDRTRFVGDALTLIAASKTGLAELELLDLLGEQGEALPAAHWARLRADLGSALLDRAGLLTFAHSYLSEAVDQEFGPDAAGRRNLHLRLAAYFDSPIRGSRRAEELPAQLAAAEEWDRLAAALSEPNLLTQLATRDEYELRRYWAAIEKETAHTFATAAKKLLGQRTSLSVELLLSLETLLWNQGHYDDCLAALTELVARLEPEGETVRLAVMLRQLADVHSRLGNMSRGAELLDRARSIFEGEKDVRGQASVLRTEIALLMTQNRYEEALESIKRASDVAMRLGDRVGLRVDLTNRAICLTMIGKLEEAAEVHIEEENLARQRRDWDGLARSLNNQGALQARRGNLRHALERHRAASDIATQNGNLRSLIVSLASQAQVLTSLGRLEEALRPGLRTAKLVEPLRDPDLLARTGILFTSIVPQLDEGQREEVLKSLKELPAMRRTLVLSLRGWADIVEQRFVPGDGASLRDLASRLEKAADLEEPDLRELRRRAAGLAARGIFQEALDVLRQAQEVAEESGARVEEFMIASDVAGIHKRRGGLSEAYDEIHRARVLSQELQLDEPLQLCLSNEAVALWELSMQTGDESRLREALALAECSLRLAEQTQHLDRQAFALGTRGLIQRHLALFKEAQRSFEFALEVARESDSDYQLARALLNLATFRMETSDFDTTHRLVEEARALADRGGLDTPQRMQFDQLREVLSNAAGTVESPTHAQAVGLSDEAHGLMDVDQLDDAERKFTELLSLEHLVEEYRWIGLSQRGFCRAKLGRHEAAIEDYTALLEIPEADAGLRSEARSNRASSFGYLGDHDAQRRDLNALIASDDTLEEILEQACLKKGLWHLERGEPELAARDLTHALESDLLTAAEQQEARYRRAMARVSAKASDHAFEDLDWILDRKPTHLSVDTICHALHTRAVLLRDRNRLQEAEVDLLRSLELDAPALRRVMVRIELAHLSEVLNKPDQARTVFDEAVAVEGAPVEQHVEALLYRGSFLARTGNRTEAFRDFNSAASLEGAPAEDVAEAILHRGFLYADGEENEKAITDFTAFLAHPHIPPARAAQALFERASAYGSLGNYKSVVRDYTTILELPSMPAERRAFCLFERGMAQDRLDYEEEALTDWVRVVEENEAPEVVALLASVLSKGGSLQDEALAPTLKRLYEMLAGHPAVGPADLEQLTRLAKEL